MRFQQIQLIAYGPFQDRCLTFESSSSHFHIIYGPNEAGKSSSLRAITDFLYGIPSRTTDDFLHPYSKLRIGALLQHSSGETLHAIRRKANQNALRCSSDSEIVDEQRLSHFTGGMAKDLFLSLYGLNHERLRAGGESIVRGTGHIGELLFASAAGLSDLRPLQAKLTADTNEYMTASGRSGKIVDRIKTLKELQAEAKSSLLHVESWNQLAEKVQKAEKEKSEYEARIQEIHKDLNRLRRISSALPLAVKLQAAQHELAKVSSAPDLPADFLDKVRQLQADWSLQQLACKQTDERLSELENEIRGLSISEEVIAAKTKIFGMREKLGIIQKSKLDIPKRVSERDTANNKCLEILKRLGHPAKLEVLETINLPDSERVRILELSREQSSLDAKRTAAIRNLERIQSELSQLEQAISVEEADVDIGPLEAAIELAMRDGDLNLKLEELVASTNLLESDADMQRRQLSPWTGSLQELEQLSLPSVATIEQFQSRFRDLEQQKKTVQTHISELDASLDEDLIALEELNRDREILSFETLHESRQHRQSLWMKIVEKWRSEPLVIPENSTPSDTATDTDTNALKRTYEDSVQRSDEVADAMREHADVIAKRQALQFEIARKRVQIEAQAGRLKESLAEWEEIKREWNRVWEPLGIEASSCQEMLTWRQQAESVKNLARQVRQKELEAQRLKSRIESLLASLQRELVAVDPKYANSHDSLATTLKAARRKLSEWQQKQNKRTLQQESRLSLISEKSEAERAVRECEQLYREWQESWGQRMQSLNLPASATPSQAEVVISNLQELFAESGRAKELNDRIKKMEIDIANFHEELTDLVERIAPDVLGRTDEEMVSLLDALREKNEFHLSLLNTKQSETKTRQEARLEQKRHLDDIQTRLDLCCQQSGCSDASQLQEVGQMSSDKRQAKQRVLEYQEQLLEFSGGQDLQDFLLELESEREQIDQHQVRIQGLESELKDLSERRDVILGDIRECNSKLTSWDGSSVAAEKFAQCESLTAELSGMAKRLAVLRMSSVLLNAAMEQHRKKNQTPVLSRASQVFSRLTCGAYSGLQADHDDRGPVLLATRSSGESVALAGLSEGTADQLYLALRIASLEEWVSRHEPMPFIVDDILITFDDDRCRAALEVLAELSKKTQVLYFTHHQHVLELAESAGIMSPAEVQSLSYQP